MFVLSVFIGTVLFLIGLMVVLVAIASMRNPAPAEIVDALPSHLFCTEPNCFEFAPCCKHDECDICAEFGTHDAPYVGKHRAYNPHKVYRGEMNSYEGKHRS